MKKAPTVHRLRIRTETYNELTSTDKPVFMKRPPTLTELKDGDHILFDYRGKGFRKEIVRLCKFAGEVRIEVVKCSVKLASI